MYKLLQYILPFKLTKRFSDEQVYHLYKKWDEPARQVQIFALTFLTACLYIIFVFIDKSWASEQVQVLMMKIYLIAIVPILLSISFLAYKKRYYKLVMPLLAFHAVFSTSCHVYITSELSNYTHFLTEGYLVVFWIFAVSGMTFRYALVSASLSSMILIVSGFYIMNEPDVYALHVFWIFCSFSFGFLAALIFDRSRKAIFISQQELQRQAVTDELTGVFNRNQLNNVLSKEMARDLRYEKKFGFLVIDIDNFKKINDTFGHSVGDEILRKVAQILASNIRSNDTLVRWGGEEFVIVAIEVDDISLNNLCENLREKIENDIYDPVDKVTVSVGATLLRSDDTQNTLLLRADKALYEAKGKGRNTTVCVK